MKSYLIGYDLNKQGQDYETLIEHIKKLGTWWHCLDSTWIIKTDKSASDIRDALTWKRRKMPTSVAMGLPRTGSGASSSIRPSSRSRTALIV